MEEMALYLTSVYKVLYEAQPSLSEHLAVTPEELAAVTTQQCFQAADLDNSGWLSLDEFKQFFAGKAGGASGISTFSGGVQRSTSTEGAAPAPTRAAPRGAGAPAPAVGGGGSEEEDEDDDDDEGSPAPASWLSLAEVKRLTNLGSQPVGSVLEAFAERADDDGALSREAFDAAAGRYVAPAALSSLDRRHTAQVLSRLFDLFDTNGDGKVDFAELASGLSVLCGGDRDDKVEAAFGAWWRGCWCWRWCWCCQ